MGSTVASWGPLGVYYPAGAQPNTKSWPPQSTPKACFLLAFPWRAGATHLKHVLAGIKRCIGCGWQLRLVVLEDGPHCSIHAREESRAPHLAQVCLAEAAPVRMGGLACRQLHGVARWGCPISTGSGVARRGCPISTGSGGSRRGCVISTGSGMVTWSRASRHAHACCLVHGRCCVARSPLQMSAAHAPRRPEVQKG